MQSLQLPLLIQNPRMQASPCPVVCAIRHAAAGNVDVLRALLVDSDTAVAPVQDPAYANSLPLHVAIKEHCVSALEVLLPVYQIAAFSRVDGYNETAIQLAQRLAALHPNGPDHLACVRALLIVAHFFLCAQIKHSDDIMDDMRGILDSPLTRCAVNDQFCSNQNQTLLHVAIGAKRVEVVKFLLQRRACIHLKMNPPLGDPRTEGPSALEIARAMHRSNGDAEEQIHRLIMEVQDNPDVFISYRRDTEKDIALVMYQTLVGAPHFLNVFLDSSSDNGFPLGADWQKYSIKMLSQSRVFVPIISYDGVLKRICSNSSNPKSQHYDNVLFEHIVALALPAIKIFPLWIGPGCMSPPPKGCVASASYPWNDVVQLHRVLPQDIAAVEALHKNVPTIEAAQRICREVFPSASVAERELREQVLLNIDVALGTVWARLKAHNGFMFEDAALQQAVAAAAAGVAPAHAHAQTLDTHNVRLKCQQFCEYLVKYAVPSIPYQPPPPPQMTRGGVLATVLANDTVAEAIFALSNFCAGLGFSRFPATPGHIGQRPHDTVADDARIDADGKVMLVSNTVSEDRSRNTLLRELMQANDALAPMRGKRVNVKRTSGLIEPFWQLALDAQVDVDGNVEVYHENLTLSTPLRELLSINEALLLPWYHTAFPDVPSLPWNHTADKDGRPFRFARLCLVGEGRAGKTALANALCDRPFVPTPSTIGVGTDCMEVTSTSVEALTAAWKVLPSDAFVGLAQQQMNWEAAQRLAGSDGAGKGSIHDMYKGNQDSVLPQDQTHSSNPSPSAAQSSHLPSSAAGHSAHPDAHPSDSPPPASAAAPALATSHAMSRPARGSSGPPVTRIDHDLVMQLQGQPEPLRINLMDFGGQEAFYSLHHLYVTRESVYLVVFNMKCMVGADATAETVKQCKSYLSFWLSSIYLHGSAQLDGSVAPIILVGTHKDEIHSPKQHEQVSKMLRDEFHSSPVWTSVQAGAFTTGCGSLHFFPVDNSLKQSEQHAVDDAVVKLQTCIQEQLEKEEYLNRKVPLSWWQAFDQLMAAKEADRLAYLPLSDVLDIANVCHLPCIPGYSLEQEVIIMLKYLSGLGLLMYHDCPKLRDIVVLDTVRCLVNPASIIMCQHDIHQLPVHFEAKARHKDEYDELVTEGRVHRSLLPVLWRDCLDLPIVGEVCELMVHYGLMLPLLQDGAPQDACVYLVPSLLPIQPPASAKSAPVRSHFCFAFGFKPKVSKWQKLNSFPARDVAAQGFCPNGLFARFTGKVISECQRTYSYFKSNCSRYQTTTFFGKHQFIIRDLKELNMIQVLVLVPSPRKLLHELSRLLQATIDEIIPNLAFCAVVNCDGGTNANYELSCVADAHVAVLTGDKGLIEQSSKGLEFDAGEGPLSAVEIQHKFQLWLPPSGLRDTGYHVFLSYRWTGADKQNPGFDEDLTSGIFHKLSMDALLTLGLEREEVNVFLDKQRLQPARDFQLDFARALLASSLPVILMSSAALLKMVALKADSPIDNLLLEWTLIADLKSSGVIKHCLVVLFGTHNKTAGSCADVLGDIFKQKMTAVLAAVAGDQNYDRARHALSSVADLDDKTIFDVLPDVAVKSVNDRARCILHDNGLPASPNIDTRSVLAVIQSLKSSLGVEAWEEAKKVSSSHANEEALRAVIKHCSDKVCAILEKERPCSALAAQASRCAPVAAQARVAAGGGDVVLDDLALQLQRVGVSKDPTVLAEMSAKLQSDGVAALQDLKGLSQEDVNKQLASLNLKPVPLNKLLKHISEL